MDNNSANECVILRRKLEPSEAPEESDFDCVPCEAAVLPDGQSAALFRTLLLYVAPSLRFRLSSKTLVRFFGSAEVGATMEGFGAVVQVAESNCKEYPVGQIFYTSSLWPWQRFVTLKLDSLNTTKLKKLDLAEIGGVANISLSMSLFGTVGLVTYLSLLDEIGGGEVMVVSAAAGGGGSLAGQIAKLLGCSKVVGICGTQEKCDVITSELGFDGAINYHDRSVGLAERLAVLCPGGIDCYFDNVGGEISDAVIAKMKPNSRVLVCGQVSQYNIQTEYPAPIPPSTAKIIQERNISRNVVMVRTNTERSAPAIEQLLKWNRCGKLKVKETIAEGLQNAGRAFASMMSGGNIGRQLIRVAHPL